MAMGIRSHDFGRDVHPGCVLGGQLRRDEHHAHGGGLLQHSGPDRRTGRLYQAVRSLAPGCDGEKAVRSLRKSEPETPDPGCGARFAQPARRRQPVRVDDDLNGSGGADQRVERLQHQGLFPGGDQRGSVESPVLQPARRGRQLDRADLQHRDAEGGPRRPAQDLGAAPDRCQGAHDFGSLRDRADLRARRGHHLAVGAVLLGQRGQRHVLEHRVRRRESRR